MKKVLVVEDETIVAMEIQDRLENIGYVVCGVAGTGKESVEMTVKEEPDVILMDIKLRGSMNGIQAAGEIRRNSNVPIVFLTAYAKEDELARIEPPFYFLPKPFDEIELRDMMERVAGHSE